MDLKTLQLQIAELRRAGVTVHELDCKDRSFVENIERQLRLELPESLKTFYNTYEYLQLGTLEVVWIKNLPQVLERVSRQGNVPTSYFPVMADGMGGYFYVVCAELNAPRPGNFGDVLHHIGGPENLFELSASDFIQFLLKCAQKQLHENRTEQ